MRKQLYALIRPLVERLANDLTELALARVEHELGRVRQAVEVAASAYASDGPPDLLTAALGPEIAAMLHPGELEVEPAPLVRGGAPVAARVAVPEPAVAAEQGSTSQPAELGDRPRTRDGKSAPRCSKCGNWGRATGCGTAHVTLVRDGEPMTAIEPKRAAPSIPPGTGRVAFLKARADAREAAKRSRQERAASFIKRQPAPDRARAEAELDADTIGDIDLAEAQKLGGELPIPHSTWEL